MKKLFPLFIAIAAVSVTHAQNVGIGTTTPSARLDVKTTTANNVANFNGLAPMWVGIYEADQYRGYWGSYSGNAEDVDFSTGLGNATGRLHLGTQGNPRLSISSSGLVGIGLGTNNAAYRLEVQDRVKIRSTLNNISGTAGIWLDDYRNNSNSAFIGMQDSIRVGFWGQNGAGWNWYFDTKTGNVVMGMGGSILNSSYRLVINEASGNNVAFYNNGSFGGSIRSTDTSLIISSAYGSTVCFPSACPASDLVFNPASTSLFSTTFPGNIGFFVNKPNTDFHVNGTVLIGSSTSTVATGYKLNVAGKAICTELKVQTTASWPDYVFNDDYALPSLEDLEKSLSDNKHLPNIPAAAEVEKNGFEVGDMNRRLLEKVEELTLYIIKQDKRIKALEAKSAVGNK